MCYLRVNCKLTHDPAPPCTTRVAAPNHIGANFTSDNLRLARSHSGRHHRRGGVFFLFFHAIPKHGLCSRTLASAPRPLTEQCWVCAPGEKVRGSIFFGPGPNPEPGHTHTSVALCSSTYLSHVLVGTRMCSADLFFLRIFVPCCGVWCTLKDEGQDYVHDGHWNCRGSALGTIVTDSWSPLISSKKHVCRCHRCNIMQLASRLELYFDSPDGHGEEMASAAASRFETPRSCGPSNKRCRASTSRRSSVRSFAVPSGWPDQVGLPRHRSRNHPGTMTGSTCVSCQTGFSSETARTKRGYQDCVAHRRQC